MYKFKTNLFLVIYFIAIFSIESSISSFNTEINSNSNSDFGHMEIPKNIEDIPFICYNNLSDSSYYLKNNQYFYEPISTIIDNSVSYFPNNCSNISDKNSLSCCLKIDSDQFKSTMDYITSDSLNTSVIGRLYDCRTNSSLGGGFKIVEDNGNTPDLETMSNELDVIDSRESVKICLSQLQQLQCFKCSQDHKTILRDFHTDLLYRIESDPNHQPLFYIKSSTFKHPIIDTSNDGFPTTGAGGADNTIHYIEKDISKGKSIAICNDYFEKLMSHCQFVNVRGKPLNQLFQPLNGKPAVFDSENYINEIFGITIPNLNEFVYVSSDNLDLFYVSNFNCFKQPIPNFQQPTCSLIINKKWYEKSQNSNDYNNNNDSDNSSFGISIQKYLNSFLNSFIIILIINIII
ncbi:hypothetical protein DDB_G0288627 [Dictyostelium discoideum AX4]|uniref:Putative uncharacterized transmembrane protein DDB_G0288627 n=1 Tax=Dictyostelium discoideum TaxID=44689 RepID=Y8027_DICDI|nr:hypothetical protein DDB_G0288627 [Dictyostelium discoideum AX4]Q54IN7.1 RecName: Full=Putative uncharacterized transmembrane protein DDB_G0288627; Flags: Precursor [Dictyostelium discoideum]EAL63117.1 hypothetical protein DDB_G0288627 [Dictyostelium discoideum AX4]|eukprot:XP_636621.1 hypothetical protein DDB_G0288627 [Dictyostelium discoideum AX4]